MEVWLTDEQIEQVAPLLKKAQQEADKGQKGMVVAQVFEDSMTVGFISSEQAKLLEKRGTIK